MTLIELANGYFVNIESSGQGEPLVLLHGFTGSARSWGEFGARLTERFHVLAVDLAGHGQNDPSADFDHYTMTQCVADTVDAVGTLGFADAHWLGYSMGGRTALHVAAANPVAIRSLALIGASPGLDCTEDRLARRSADEVLAARIERDGVPPFIDYWENIPLFASQRALPPEQRERIRAGRLGNSSEGLANSLRGMGAGAQEPLHNRLATLTMPTLIMAGELDQKYVEIGREMALVMPNARFQVISGAGHSAQTERPVECAASVIRFIESLDANREN